MGFAQNDAHIYCTLDQVKNELRATLDMTMKYYKMFRFENIKVRFSTHDPKNKAKFVDNPELWAFSEQVVKEVIDATGIAYDVGPGEAAFYGPKIDLQATTLLGREESIGTVQLDFSQPITFNLNYVDRDGREHRPYVVHRAPLGAHERFLAFLIEHLGGAFPTWLTPTQVVVIPVGEEHYDYAKEIADLCRADLMRVEVDDSSNSFNKRVREAIVRKIPNILVVGGREKENRSVTLRRYCVKEQLTLSLEAFLARMQKLVRDRVMDNFPDVVVE